MRYLILLLFVFAHTATMAGPPRGWASKTQECMGEVHNWIDKQKNPSLYRKDLYLTKADGGSLNIGAKGMELGFTFPGIGLNKTAMPGAGNCCVFDEKLEIKEARMVLHGNDECWDLLRATKDKANKKRSSLKNKKWHGMLQWCVGPQQNCFVDVWHEYHVK
jgi:hypothetical protein